MKMEELNELNENRWAFKEIKEDFKKSYTFSDKEKKMKMEDLYENYKADEEMDHETQMLAVEKEMRKYMNENELDEELQIKFKYSEDKILDELVQHINRTYKSHYALNNSKQTLEVFHEINPELATAYCFSNAMKYLLRFGKKEGKNRKDLLKALHCIMLLFHYEFYANENSN